MEEANSVGFEEGWWLETGATVYVSYDKSTFITYKECTDGRYVKMCNDVRAKVVGIDSGAELHISQATDIE